ncbi:hypothetical protein SERLADRAFT_435774 [Serpula lacrymans var. lacrymans S7.9]|uniref:DDE-1 domain-containing protein n=1 Tax=Serpula lacrymans var. lacrymans (strain S7.9) TaxID=578457 RepID=F8NN80_SERL9|nr:uncharacterized protein SERLADRAFT_435774 [Serpula lacrymans var. lacrymans S7.9]EGO28001.1 hypothetical protein SERLADRAFT_435774 [Serpula lacrymans var. lacrymans S7.9]
MELKSNTSDNISRIKYLSKLFKSLPDDLPLNPASSRYRFGLDGEELEENGHWYALNHNLEICFQAHSLRGEPLKITERGKSLDTLLKMLQDGMREAPGDAELIMNWVERLIAAAMVSGAKNVKQTSKRKMAFSSSDEGSAAQPAIKTALKKRGPTRKARDRLPVKGTAVTPITIVDDTDTSSDTETTAPRVHSEPLRARETAKPKMPRLVALDDSDDEHDGDDVDDGELPKPVRKRQSTLFAFSGFKKLSKAEADEQNRREMAETRQEAEDERVREAMVRNLRETQKREGARERKRKSRFSKKAKEIRSGKRNSAGKIMKKMVLGHETPAAGVPDLSDLAELSRPGKIWKKGRNVKLKGTIQNRHSRTNWYHPYLWVHINNVASRVAWSPTFIVSTLQKDHPSLFAKLHRGTVFKWISKKGKKWSKKTVENVARRSVLARTGRVGILSPHREIVEEVTSQLKDLRLSGVPVNILVARSILIAVIKERQPELLDRGDFFCSESYVRDFLESTLDWSVRKGTRAAAHIPDNADDLCEAAFFRIVHLANWYDIPLSLLINMDQTGVYLVPGNNVTFNDRGAKQVNIASKDEKRAYTLVVASSCAGDLLPFQQVWSGASVKSCPTGNAKGMEEALDRGFHFTFANSPKKTSHFSTFKTMVEWMECVYIPYVNKIIRDEELPEDQKSILFIDCYPVHTGEEFRNYCRHHHPNVFVIYVPANCTGIYQPADVGLQRVTKHALKQESLNFLVESHRQQLAGGLKPEAVRFTHSLPVLRDATVAPAVHVYDMFKQGKGPELVRKAWSKCQVKQWCLSPEVIQHRDTKAALRKYLQDHPTFKAEIDAKIGDVYGIDSEHVNPEDDFNNEGADMDDSEVPIGSVIQEALGNGLGCMPFSAAGHGIASSEHTAVHDGGFLRGLAEGDDIWAWNVDGTRISTLP